MAQQEETFTKSEIEAAINLSLVEHFGGHVPNDEPHSLSCLRRVIMEALKKPYEPVPAVELKAFRCPHCGDVATAKDFPSGSEQLGQACVGRFLGALGCRSNDEWTASGGRGCDWCAFGLFSGPWTVIMPNGKEVGSFPLADVP